MKEIDLKMWLDARRDFAKSMMKKAIETGNAKDEQYYLGRMNEAKMIKERLTSKGKQDR